MKKMLIALTLLILALVTSCYDVHKAPKKRYRIRSMPCSLAVPVLSGRRN